MKAVKTRKFDRSANDAADIIDRLPQGTLFRLSAHLGGVVGSEGALDLGAAVEAEMDQEVLNKLGSAGGDLRGAINRAVRKSGEIGVSLEARGVTGMEIDTLEELVEVQMCFASWEPSSDTLQLCEEPTEPIRKDPLV